MRSLLIILLSLLTIFFAANCSSSVDADPRCSANGFDACEPDNSPKQAVPIKVGDDPIARAIDQVGDIDWFSTELTDSEQIYTLEVSNGLDNCGIDITVQIYATDTTTLLGQSSVNGADGCPYLAFQPEAAGKIYIKIFASDNASVGNYSFAIQSGNPPTNVSPVASTAGSDYAGTTGSPVSLVAIASFDPDFAICGSESSLQTYRWSFQSTPPGSNLQDADIVSFDENQASFTPDVTGTYTLRFSFGDDPGWCRGGSKTTHVSLDIVIGTFLYNIGAFSCGPNASHDHEVDTYLKLYAANGTTLLAEDDDSGPVGPKGSLYAAIGYPLVSGQTYYAVVANSRYASTGCYTFMVSTTDLPAAGSGNKGNDTSDVFPDKTSADGAGPVTIDAETYHFDYDDATGLAPANAGDDWYRIDVP